MIKLRLCSLLPGIQIFLDVDDLRTGNMNDLESFIISSQFVLAFISAGYFRSFNVCRELRTAIKQKKHVISVLDHHSSHSGLSFTEAEGELIASKEARAAFDVFALRNYLFEHPPIVFERDGAFQVITLRHIAAKLVNTSPDQVYIPGELTVGSLELKPPSAPHQYHVYCSENNPGAFGVLKQLHMMQQLSVTTEPNLAPLAQSFCLYLDASTWTSPHSELLADEVSQAIDAGRSFLLIHESGENDHAVSFSRIIEATPPRCRPDQLYLEIAIPLRTGAARIVSFTLMIQMLNRTHEYHTSFLGRIQRRGVQPSSSAAVLLDQEASGASPCGASVPSQNESSMLHAGNVDSASVQTGVGDEASGLSGVKRIMRRGSALLAPVLGAPMKSFEWSSGSGQFDQPTMKSLRAAAEMQAQLEEERHQEFHSTKAESHKFWSFTQQVFRMSRGSTRACSRRSRDGRDSEQNANDATLSCPTKEGPPRQVLAKALPAAFSQGANRVEELPDSQRANRKVPLSSPEAESKALPAAQPLEHCKPTINATASFAEKADVGTTVASVQSELEEVRSMLNKVKASHPELEKRAAEGANRVEKLRDSQRAKKKVRLLLPDNHSTGAAPLQQGAPEHLEA